MATSDTWARWVDRLADLPRSKWLPVPIILVLAIALLFGRSAEARRESYGRDAILAAIRFVESSDRPNPPDGDGGRAIGPYQIHNVYWRDAIEHDPTLGGTYQDCRDRGYAERVIDAYMRRWAAEAWRDGDAETVARVHNGGPTGAQKTATDGYWERVLARLTAAAP